MNIVRPDVHVEGLLPGLRLLDERQGRVDEAAGDGGTLHPFDGSAEAFGIGPDPAGFILARLQGQRQEFRAQTLEVRT